MDDADLLLAAVAANPADDFARLVYADLREDRGDADYARFIREQVRLTPLPPWHPDVVRARWHETGLLDGTRFAVELPPTGTRAWEWPARDAYHRGLPGSIVVRDLTGFVDYSAELFAALPIRELHLPTAALSEWQRFAAQPWLPRIESVRFYGVSTPIEALRVLCETPNATGLTSIALEKAGGPAIPVLLEDLFTSPLGRQLRRLELHARMDDEEHAWIEALAGVDDGHALREMSLTTMGLGHSSYMRLLELPLTQQLRALELRHNSLSGFEPVFLLPLPAELERCVLFDSRIEVLNFFHAYYGTTDFGRLRQLVCGHSAGQATWPRSVPSGLVSLGMSHCGFHSTQVPRLLNSDFWQRAVELDLRGNSLYRQGLELLIDAGPGPELVALVLDRGHADKPLGRRFVERYEGRVAFG